MSVESNSLYDQVKDFSSLRPVTDREDQELLKASVTARDFAYAPYSQFSVGAAVRTSDGIVYTGCNIENSAYPVSLCAERTAIAKAVSEGKTKLVSVAVCGVHQPDTVFVTPCGSCRQFISEFTKDRDIPVYLVKPDMKKVLVSSIKQLLPGNFHF